MRLAHEDLSLPAQEGLGQFTLFMHLHCVLGWGHAQVTQRTAEKLHTVEHIDRAGPGTGVAGALA